jgi:hypothetical protein
MTRKTGGEGIEHVGAWDCRARAFVCPVWGDGLNFSVCDC